MFTNLKRGKKKKANDVKRMKGEMKFLFLQIVVCVPEQSQLLQSGSISYVEQLLQGILFLLIMSAQ